MIALKVPSPFIRFRCSSCNCWVREDAIECQCGARFSGQMVLEDVIPCLTR